jgi:hypothetical protein
MCAIPFLASDRVVQSLIRYMSSSFLVAGVLNSQRNAHIYPHVHTYTVGFPRVACIHHQLCGCAGVALETAHSYANSSYACIPQQLVPDLRCAACKPISGDKGDSPKPSSSSASPSFASPAATGSTLCMYSRGLMLTGSLVRLKN